MHFICDRGRTILCGVKHSACRTSLIRVLKPVRLFSGCGDPEVYATRI
jgi:hypothetical protein